MVQFRSLDLNLLKLFLILLETRSVTRAAAELSLSPSAVSHALNRLRDSFEDPLFERRGGRLAPTPQALEIARRLKPAMAQLRDALEYTQFNPKTDARDFVILAGSYASSILLPHLLEQINTVSSHTRIVAGQIMSRYHEDIERGTIDLAFGVMNAAFSTLEWMPLLSDELVWVARKDHPFVHPPITEEMIRRARHVVMEPLGRYLHPGLEEARRLMDGPAGMGTGVPTEYVDPAGYPPLAGALVSDSSHALAIVSRTDFISLTLRRLAERYLGGSLQIMEPVQPVAKIPIGAVYRADRKRDPGFAWFLDQIAISIKKVDAA